MKDITELTTAERNEIDQTMSRWLEGLQVTPKTNRQDRFSPTEMTEMAYADVLRTSLEARFKMMKYGHAVLTVGYPKGYNVAQHDVHQRLQQDHEMVTVEYLTLDTGDTIVIYMHRSDHDDAVRSGAMEAYK